MGAPTGRLKLGNSERTIRKWVSRILTRTTICICIYIYIYIYIYLSIYPPTPADARGSAPGNKTFYPLARQQRHGVSPPSLSAMVFSRPGGAFFEAICWLNDVANSCSSCSRSRAAATTKVAAEQLTLPRAAKCWKFVFPSSSSFRGMVFPLRRSVPWCFRRCIFGGNLLAKRCGKQLQQPQQMQHLFN